jgi:hypothetical protein
MPKQTIHIFIAILLLLAFGVESLAFTPRVEAPIHSDCSFLDYSEDYLLNEVKPYISVLVSSLTRVGARTLSDQGFLSSIFRPPRPMF